jgi:hypothetical protein
VNEIDTDGQAFTNDACCWHETTGFRSLSSMFFAALPTVPEEGKKCCHCGRFVANSSAPARGHGSYCPDRVVAWLEPLGPCVKKTSGRSWDEAERERLVAQTQTFYEEIQKSPDWHVTAQPVGRRSWWMFW